METRPPSTDAVSNTTTTTTTTASTAETVSNIASNNNINNDVKNNNNIEDTDNNNGSNSENIKKKAVRHAEKRRTATCSFSNRVAAISVQHYRQHVSRQFQQTQKQTCLATIVAHERLKPAACVVVDPDGTTLPPASDRLTVVGMGVGTKFLSESLLQNDNQQQTNNQKVEGDDDQEEESYGSRVRDCHAEVLARRAFRCHLSLEMKRLLVQQQHVPQQGQQAPDPVDSILECVTTTSSPPGLAFRLQPGVTLHLYTSSAPCGNACLKKFATMANQAEVFREDLRSDEWPIVNKSDRTHEYTPGHSIPLGQFALLVKKDSSVVSMSSYEDYQNQHMSSSINGNNSNNSKKRGRVESGSSEEKVATAISITAAADSTTAAATTTTAVASVTGTAIGETTASAASNVTKSNDNATSNQTKTKRGGKKSKSPAHFPANMTDTWCPPGTTTVWSGRGSLHTCSDKICRWNCLGLQGSLLVSLLLVDPDTDQQNNQPMPLYLSTVTVGRKLTPVVCRRAICCRVGPTNHDIAKSNSSSSSSSLPGPSIRLHHPTVMGTSVYMDDSGVIDMSNKDNNNKQQTGQDVRFHSTLSWAWWPALSTNGQEQAECIDGATGWAVLPRRLESEENGDETTYTIFYDDSNPRTRSMVSTASLLEFYMQIDQTIQKWILAGRSDNSGASAMEVELDEDTTIFPRTLTELRSLKKQVSGPYEDSKEHLLTKHPVLRQWKRRENHSAGYSLAKMEAP